jgi:amino-acid N-acetyltransferase
MTDGVEIAHAQKADADAVLGLLEQSRLPLDGLTEHWGTTLVARREGRIVGSAALEVYADGALLRSVAVASDLHGHGIGHRLTEATLALARELQLPAVYLLTTTADAFFPRFGFERIGRGDVPQSVQASVEFRSACPSSATVMRKTLGRHSVFGEKGC